MIRKCEKAAIVASSSQCREREATWFIVDGELPLSIGKNTYMNWQLTH